MPHPGDGDRIVAKLSRYLEDEARATILREPALRVPLSGTDGTGRDPLVYTI